MTRMRVRDASTRISRMRRWERVRLISARRIKHQTPNSKLQKNSKHHTSSRAPRDAVAAFGTWNLRLVWGLEFETWGFENSFEKRRKRTGRARRFVWRRQARLTSGPARFHCQLE